MPTPIVRKWISLCLLALASLITGCASPGPAASLLEPKIVQTGGLPLLYHANNAQILKLFPVGTPRAAIHEKFGKPTLDSGSTTDTDIYAYGQAYSKLNLDRSSFTLTRTVTAQISYTASGRVKEVTPSIFQQYVAAQNGVPEAGREPTEDEIQQYLPISSAQVDESIAKGFPGIAVASASTAGEAAKKSDAAVAPWRPGLQIMEYQSNTGRTEIRVTGFDANSPAKTKGVRLKDAIVAVNGIATGNAGAYSKALSSASNDKPLVLKLLRAGKTVTITLTPGK